jgi:hypothetical protein
VAFKYVIALWQYSCHTPFSINASKRPSFKEKLWKLPYCPCIQRKTPVSKVVLSRSVSVRVSVQLETMLLTSGKVQILPVRFLYTKLRLVLKCFMVRQR